MTTWSDFQRGRPLTGDALRAYERERAKMGIGYLILKARSKADFSQADLAKRIGSTQPMVARWESGAQVPNLNTLIKIAEATGYDLAVGLHDQKAAENRFVALAYVGGSGRRATLRMVREDAPTYRSKPATARKRSGARASAKRPRAR
jgi:transcriptional regulator with XRE-family HTH domain